MSQFEKSAQEMLGMINAEIQLAEERLRKLKERRSVIAQWVAEENPQTELPINTKPRIRIEPRPKRLEDFLREIISDSKARTNAELAQAAQNKGWKPEGDKVDLRSINATMLGYQKLGAVHREADKWVPRKNHHWL